jgi:nicotinate-nucleotide--dimethylbenzimidazole phosphoribosyltransferase
VNTSLGTLAGAVSWASSVQGEVRPHPFRSVRVVLVAAEHGIASRGVSADPPSATAARAKDAASGTGVYARLALAAHATIRVVADDLPASAPLGSAEVLTPEEVTAAYERGCAVADAEADAGVDLVVPAIVGVGASTPAAALIAALTDLEPAAMTGRGSGIDDETWMRKCVAVRDGLRRARGAGDDAMALLAATGGADLAVVTGLLHRCAERRTPVLLDGVTVLAAALLARSLPCSAQEWWFVPHAGDDPAEREALRVLGLEPAARLGLRLGDGAGALAVLPLLQTALDLDATTDPAEG